MRVRTNAVYVFVRAGWDLFDRKNAPDIANGTRVQVIALPGCPKPNTMGHAHVADPTTGQFLGLVSTNSLNK